MPHLFNTPGGPPPPQLNLSTVGHQNGAAIVAKEVENAAARFSLFSASGRLARIVSGKVEELTIHLVLVLLATLVSFRRGNRIAKPDRDLALLMLTSPPPGVPVLRRLARGPLFKDDGTIQAAGFNPATGVLVVCTPLVRPVSPSPTEHERAEARVLILNDLLFDFPYASDASGAAAVAMLLVLFLREVIVGLIPMFLLNAPSPGTGKGLHAQVPSLIFSGNLASPTTFPHSGRSDNEARWKLFGALHQGHEVLLLDNLVGYLDSEALASMLTASEFSDRVIGSSEVRVVQNRAMWVATGNGVRLSTDLARRTIEINLDAKMEKPWQRSGFKHPDLQGWIGQWQDDLRWACLTIIQAWIVAGRPLGTAVMGSFQQFASMLSGILDHAGVPGFLTAPTPVDPEDEVLRGIFAFWVGTHGSQPISAVQFGDICEKSGLWPQCLSGKKGGSLAQGAGFYLGGLKGRIVDGWRLDARFNLSSKSNNYVLTRVQADLPGASGGYRGISSSTFDGDGENEVVEELAEPPEAPGVPGSDDRDLEAGFRHQRNLRDEQEELARRADEEDAP